MPMNIMPSEIHQEKSNLKRLGPNFYKYCKLQVMMLSGIKCKKKKKKKFQLQLTNRKSRGKMKYNNFIRI